MEPSEQNEWKNAAAEAAGPVYVDCTPLNPFTAKYVVQDAGGHAIFRNPAAQGDPHCFAVEYTNRAGRSVQVTRRLGIERHGTFY